LSNKTYINYHKHSSYSNVYTKDSPITVNDYLYKLKEIGGKQVYSTVEHGFQSPYFRIYDELEQFNNKNNTDIKFVFGAEVYWVKNRFESDNSNCHMILLARNENGRKALNKAISIANKTGYYYKPRLDLDLILNLPSEDIFVTTACIAFWNKYNDIDEIVQKLNNHFEYFYLEVQAHNTEPQIKINKHIIKLHNEYNIPLIAGVDSHVISKEQLLDRDDLLKSAKMHYDEEDGWFMDFPDYDTLVKRFEEQGVLSDIEIETAIETTNAILNFDDIKLDRSMKLPTLYPTLSQQEKDKIFVQTIFELWEKEKNKVVPEKCQEYTERIMNELSEILGCSMCDYFLFNKKVIELGIEKYGGELTQSGRGSNVAMYLNKLLGFTNIDCISAPVHMYYERFLTKERVLESKTPPDEDFNVSDRKPFIEAQKELLGDNGCYDLIAFGTLHLKSAFKMYSRANNIDPQIANEVSKQIEKYEKALLYADEDEKEEINVFDYVDKEQFGYIIDGCQRYLGIIDNRKGHPCGTVVASCDIEEEIGIILCKSETTGKEVLTALIESITIDAFGWLKNDFLIVDSTRLINAVYKKIGMKPIEVNDLLQIIKNDDKVWKIYNDGITQCINQCEKDKTTQKMTRFKAKNIVELTQFIAGIRPSFKSLYSYLENRERYQYNIKALDNLLQNEYCNSSFILFQEDLMKILNFAGFPMKDTYTIIKAISKKKKDKIAKIKPMFIENFAQKIIETGDADNNEDAYILSEKVWGIVEDFSSYGFNSPHGFSYAIDSVTQAWQKANYPYEFYEVVLQRFTDKGEKDKVSLLKKEMKYFGIELKPIKFRDDNRGFVSYKERGYITQPLNSIKNISKDAPNILYNIKDVVAEDFVDLLVYITENTNLKKNNIEILIQLDYFSEYGDINYLLKIYEKYKELYKKTYVGKTKIKRISEIKDFVHTIEKNTTTLIDKIKFQIELIGYTDIVDETLSDKLVFVTDLTFNQYGTPFVTLYNISIGSSLYIKVDKNYFNKKPFEIADMLSIVKISNDKKYWIKDKTEYENVLHQYSLVVE
jgi:DNA polymerase III alpha subunit